MIYDILRYIAILILNLFFRLEIKGKENIPSEGGFILASNHVSFLDPIVLGAASSRKLTYIARHNLFTKPILSWLLPKIHVFPLKRDSADISALKGAINRIRGGRGLLLFPEGRRGQINSIPVTPQPGVGFLAAKVNVPVIPAFVKGTEKALPKQAKFLRPAKIKVVFGRQIYIERRMPYQAIADLVMNNIRHLSW